MPRERQRRIGPNGGAHVSACSFHETFLQGQPAPSEVPYALTMLSAVPSSLPTRLRMTASMRNCKRIWQRFALTAIRMPILLVRSVTETRMMFMLPIPPTKIEIEAMVKSMTLRV